ncbi:MAG: NADH:ubiquinone reductase (Na(+)-transporting) subunit E [candidate division KSB1 bacterium]|nr:NADH:ubiquinone reductase (Na(+)-transporting) subunit E [candidate division KSB1 bacterium]MDZ7385681.1 NADH:ubiquinone reductase (Na(+)-transporting) subunit E [candidate division KSB1 bacterium]MDZ7393825.1 NADH:ubiquinone reductase (Na(+)-transporting) subunit E [candidate division KSB1 bacterium]
MSPYVIFFAAIFTNNIALTYFLGMCPFIAVSRDLKTATGMGLAVIFVMSLTALFAWPVYHWVLVPYNVQYLQLVSFIVIIAALVQIVEMVIERFSPTLYINMGVFLPLITVNCAILGLALFMVLRNYSFIQSMAYAVGSGIGWTVVIVAMAGIRTKLIFAKVPKALEGPGITMIIAGLMALGFMGFAGIVNLQ